MVYLGFGVWGLGFSGFRVWAGYGSRAPVGLISAGMMPAQIL